MCVSGVCSANAEIAESTCPFGDDLILDKINFATSFNLPEIQMTCENAWNLGAISNMNFCSDSNFKSICCNFCKKFDTVTCTDITSSCSGYSTYCHVQELVERVIVSFD